MSQNFEKLKTLLQELFQLDLDFGLYRVMHAKSAEVSQFLDQDLLPQVQTAFDQYKTADKAEIEKDLAAVIAGVEAAGTDPAQLPKVTELRARLASVAAMRAQSHTKEERRQKRLKEEKKDRLKFQGTERSTGGDQL